MHAHTQTHIRTHVVEILTRLAPTLTLTTRLSELLRLIGRAKDVQSCRCRGDRDGDEVKVGVPDPWSSPASYSSSPSSFSSPPSVLLFNLILPILKRFAPRQSNGKQQLPRALVLLLLLLLLLLLCFQLPEFENSFTSIMPNKG